MEPMRQTFRSRSSSLLPPLALALSGFAATPAAAEPPTVVVLFDGSGSMWGKPDGEQKTKLVLAREALLAALKRTPAEARVGLMSFGHRRSGDCNDVEVIVKPESGTAQRIGDALEKHNPRGRGPLTNALREAAKELGPQSAPASVILIHDDLDNCQLDPCTAIGDLRRAHPKVAIHVVSLAMKREESQRMVCLTRATGGKHYEAATAAQANAALEDAMKLAGYDKPKEAPSPAAKPGATARPAIDPRAPAGKPGVQLSARLAAGGDPIDGPIRWRVQKAGEPGVPPVFEGDAAAPFLELPSGRYEVEAQLGFVVAKGVVDAVAGAPKALSLVLGAGLVRLANVQQGAADAVRDSVLTFSRTDAATETVAMLRGIEPEIALSPGTYLIAATAGPLRIERSVVIRAGERTLFEPQLNFGVVDLQAVATAGGAPLDPVLFTLFEDDPDSPQGRREIARSAAARPTLSLPAGTYYAVARHGSAEARERLTVRPGEVERRILVQDAARLAVTARLPGGLRETTDPVSLRLERLDEPRDTSLASQPTAVFNVPAGRYRLESRVGQGNVRAERAIELKSGAREQVTLELPAGSLRLRLLDQVGGPPLADVAWEVRDASGKVVWLGTETEARPLLLQGRYGVRAETKDRRVNRDVEVRAGEARAVDIVGR